MNYSPTPSKLGEMSVEALRQRKDIPGKLELREVTSVRVTPMLVHRYSCCDDLPQRGSNSALEYYFWLEVTAVNQSLETVAVTEILLLLPTTIV